MQVTAPPHRREESEEIWATGQSERRLILKNISAGASNNRIDSQPHSIGSLGTPRSTTIRPLLYHGGFPSLPGVIYRGFRPGQSPPYIANDEARNRMLQAPGSSCLSVLSKWMAGEILIVYEGDQVMERGRHISY